MVVNKVRFGAYEIAMLKIKHNYFLQISQVIPKNTPRSHLLEMKYMYSRMSILCPFLYTKNQTAIDNFIVFCRC